MFSQKTHMATEVSWLGLGNFDFAPFPIFADKIMFGGAKKRDMFSIL